MKLPSSENAGFGPMPDEFKDKPTIRSSNLRLFRQSPRHYVMRDDLAETSAMRFGTAFHSALLEPKSFQKDYQLKPDFPRKSKDQPLTIKEQHQNWLDENPGVKEISQSDLDRILLMIKSCYNHKVIPSLLNSPDAIIEKPFWHNTKDVVYTGTPDLVIPSKGIIVDVKTTTDASPKAWAHKIAQSEYMIQAALYFDAMNAIFGEGKFDNFIWLVVETKWPTTSMTYFPEENEFNGLIDHGRKLIESSSIDFLKCLKEKQWSGYSDGLTPITIPDYAWHQYREKDENDE